jgi:hypothetical protein
MYTTYHARQLLSLLTPPFLPPGILDYTGDVYLLFS